MGEKEGILQFLFHGLMIRQQPDMWHVWNVCPSIQSMRVIVSGEGRKGSMQLSLRTHMHTCTRYLCLSMCLCHVCRPNARWLL